MKYNRIIPVVALAALYLTSCDDQKMDWYKDPTHGEVTTAEIPLQLSEQIANYKTIKEYAAQYLPGMTVGLGLGADLYMSDPEYKRVADENFQMFTTGNAMKHASVVTDKGALNFTTIDKFFAAIPADMPVYGHNLIWHSQQRTAYLNSIIADKVIVIPDAEDKMLNVLQGSDFEDGTKGSWGSWGNGSSSSISAKGEGYNSDYAMVLVNPTASNSWDAQAGYTLPAVLEVGKVYCYSIMVKADVVNTDFTMQVQNSATYSGEGYVSGTTAVGQWILIEGEFECKSEGLNRMCINFAKAAGTYLVDNIKFGEKRVEKMTNILDNSTFEDGTIAPWGGWGNSSTRAISAKGEGYESDYCMVLTNPTSADSWSAQAAYSFPMSLEVGKIYCYEVMVKADVVNPDFTLQVQNSSTNSGIGYVSGTTAINQWLKIEGEFTCNTEGMNRMCINYGKVGGVYCIDNIKFGEKKDQTVAAGAIASKAIEIVPYTAEEKKQIITEAMENWIKGMVEHCKDRVTMWDVLNEPVTDGNLLRGVEYTPETQGDQEFYWGQYMGKEYAVKAFQWARQYGNPGDKLFVNDYNLEVSPEKLAKLIELVDYIDKTNESPIVDGIGTQMHLIAATITREKLDNMFKTMAATGKLIRITELDVRVETLSPTLEQLQLQQEVYRMAIESYKQHVPAAQQSGITAWTLTDDAREHEYWFPNDVPNLFDKNYGRKLAYKGICDGIAGFDIGATFSGDEWKNAY